MVVVGIVEDGEFRAESREGFHVELGGDGLWGAGPTFFDDTSTGIDEHRAAVVLALRVVANAVHSCHIALVFDGSGAQQCVPYFLTRIGP